MDGALRLADRHIRPALLAKLLTKHAKDEDTVVVDELGICQGRARIDVAVVNGTFHGYEIKSDRDSLRRLAGQADLYGRVLDRVTLVVGERHMTDALAVVPDWWGILRFEPGRKKPRFRTIRRGRRNPLRDARSLVELLWLDDAIKLLEERDAVRGVRGKPRRVVWDRVCAVYDTDEIADAVRDRVKARATPPSPQPPQ